MDRMQPNLKCSSSAVLNDENKPDYFEKLPETILIEILDKLPVEEAIGTTILSKRWKDLWRCKQNIEIGYSWVEKTSKEVLPSLFEIFDSLGMQDLHSISVSLHYYYYMPTRIKSLIAYVSSKNVKELHIDFNDRNAYQRVRWMRQMPLVPIRECERLPCLALVKLSLKSVQLQTLPRFRALKELYLEFVILNADLVKTITGNCSLSLLCLCNCNPDRDLYIIVAESSNLRHLIIREDLLEVVDTDMCISAPNVRALEFGLALPRNRYKIQGSLDCSEATFRLNQMPCSQQQAMGVIRLCMRINSTENFLGLLEKLRAVNVLTLCSWCIQVLAIELMNLRRPLTLDVRHLILETAEIRWEFKGVAYMLLGCNKLEKLVVVMTPSAELYFNFKECLYYYSNFVNFRNILQELKVLEFRIGLSYNETLDGEVFNIVQFFERFSFGRLLHGRLMAYSRKLERLIFTTRRSRFEYVRLQR